MTNSNNCPIFIDSTLKIVASEDLNIHQDLDNEQVNLPIEELLHNQEHAKKE